MANRYQCDQRHFVDDFCAAHGVLVCRGFKSLDIIDQLVDDGDLNTKLKYQLYQSELATKTLPIIDGIHKLGRQMLTLVQVGFYAWAVKAGVEITPELVAGGLVQLVSMPQ